ncbi:MAG: lipocalin family protein [Bacteroidota bacterium]
MNTIAKILLKNSLVTVGFIFLTTLSSCGSDDGPVNDTNIIGVWQISEITIDGEVDEEIAECTYEDTVEFKSDNTYVEMNYASPAPNDPNCVLDEDSSDTGTWSIPSAGRLSVTFTFGEDDFTQIANYSISGNTLSISFDVNGSDYTTIYTRI